MRGNRMVNGDIVIGIEFTARSNPRGYEISWVSHSFIELLYTMSWLWSDELLLSSFFFLSHSVFSFYVYRCPIFAV